MFQLAYHAVQSQLEQLLIDQVSGLLLAFDQELRGDLTGAMVP